MSLMHTDLTKIGPLKNFDPSKYPKVEGWSIDPNWLPPRHAFRILRQTASGKAVLAERPEGGLALITGEARALLEGGAQSSLFAGAMPTPTKALPVTTGSFTGAQCLGDEPVPPLAEGEAEGEGNDRRPQVVHRVLIHELELDLREHGRLHKGER